MSGLLDAASPAVARPTDHPCCLCGHASRQLFQANGFWIRQCTHCQHQFVEVDVPDVHVSQVYSDEYFTSGGAGYRGYLREQSVLAKRARWYTQLLSRYMTPGTLLDVGAAAGFFLDVLVKGGWKVQGIEPNASMVEHAQTHFQLPVAHGTFEEFDGSGPFDLVTMLQVIAHFAQPQQVVSKAASLIRTGGYLLIETWDRNSLAARAFGRSWHEYNPPSVLHMFSRNDLIKMVCNAGFELNASGYARRSITVGHAKSVLQHKAASSLTNRLLLAIASLLSDETTVPYPGDDLFWALFRRTTHLS